MLPIWYDLLAFVNTYLRDCVCKRLEVGNVQSSHVWEAVKKVRSDPTVSLEIAQPLALGDIFRLETLKGAVRRISSAISGRVLLRYWRCDSSAQISPSTPYWVVKPVHWAVGLVN